MIKASTPRRQPIIGYDLKLQLLEFKGRAKEVADILPRKVPQGAADVAALMDKLFPPSRDETRGPTWARPRRDVVHNLVSHMGWLIEGRWRLLSVDRRDRLFRWGESHWWRHPSDCGKGDAAARAIWERVRCGRADAEDARVILDAAAAILRICDEVIAMHYEAAHTPPLPLSTWKPWKMPKTARGVIALHAS